MKPFLAVSLVIAVTAWALPSAAQERTISVAAEEVRVDILVTENGKPVMDLTADDFEVFDNGILQEIQYARPQQQMPISATLVFDMSGSVEGMLLDDLKSVRTLEPGEFEKKPFWFRLASRTVCLAAPLL